MVRVIKQETYDEVVKENIEEFDMPPEEAINEAVKQFEAQGVDLSNIIKDLVLNDNVNVIHSCLKKLTTEDQSHEIIIQTLEQLKTELSKDIARKLYANKANAYNILLKLINEKKSDKNILKTVLQVFIVLMTGNPDVLDQQGIKLQNELIDEQTDPAIIQLVLKWIKECCVKHEMNRQNIFTSGIVDKLKKLLNDENTSGSLLRDVCSVIRGLVLDDDIRHEYGKAHDHACQLALSTLDKLTSLLPKFKDDKAVVGDLMLTLATLVVRNEFCQNVKDADGLTYILDVMINHPDTEKLNWQALKLLKALAGNDNVKAHIVTCGSAPLIVSAISRFSNSESVIAASLSCITALTLKSSSNAGVFYDCGAPAVIINAMKQYPKSINILAQGSNAIRNMSVRNKNESREFLIHGVESVLTDALKTHGPALESEVKGALRDLGLKVELKERWTGKGTAMKND